MSKTNKVTFGMIAAKMSPVNTKEIEIADDMKISVVYTLPMKDAFAFVNDVASACVNTSDEKYMPEVHDFAVRVSVLRWYAGIDMPKGKDMEKAYRVVYETDLFNKVFDEINHDQFDILLCAADERIKFECDAMMATATQSVSKLVAKMDDMVSGSAEIMKQFESEDFKATLENMMQLMQAGKDSAAKPVAGGEQSTSGNIIKIPRKKETK